MANLTDRLDIISNHSYGVYEYARTSYDHRYYHIKTSITHQSYLMTRIEFKGYCYGNNQFIDCWWTFYPYDYFIAHNQGYLTGGMIPVTSYKSSDNYVCVYGDLGSNTGDVFFNVNIITANPTSGGAVNTTVLSAASTASSGTYY